MVDLELTEVHIEGVILREKEGDRSLLVLGSQQWTEAIARIVQEAPVNWPEPDPVPSGSTVSQSLLTHYAGDGVFAARIEHESGTIECEAILAIAVALARGAPIRAADDAVGGGGDFDAAPRDGMHREPLNLDLAEGAAGRAPVHDVEAGPHGPCFVLRAAEGTQSFVEQAVRPDPFELSCVRFGAMVRAVDVVVEADIVVRVSGPGTRIQLFSAGPPLGGTTAWMRREVVFEVPRYAERIDLGARVIGTGELRAGPFDLMILGPAGTAEVYRLYDSLRDQFQLRRPELPQR